MQQASTGSDSSIYWISALHSTGTIKHARANRENYLRWLGSNKESYSRCKLIAVPKRIKTVEVVSTVYHITWTNDSSPIRLTWTIRSWGVVEWSKQHFANDSKSTEARKHLLLSYASLQHTGSIPILQEMYHNSIAEFLSCIALPFQKCYEYKQSKVNYDISLAHAKLEFANSKKHTTVLVLDRHETKR